MIRILIADDHQMFLDGIKSLLKNEPDIKIIGEALTGGEVMAFLLKQQPDIILMDMRMPVMNGLETTIAIKKKYPHCKVVMLTMDIDGDVISAILDAGAEGYILKNTGKEELETAIRRVADGSTFYSNEVTEKLIASYKNKLKDKEVKPEEVELTSREKEVLELIAKEFTTSEIAAKLYLSAHTVETYRKNLLNKLDVRNIAGLVKYAIKNGFE
ncbi:MAG: response regulator transcription factor [Bacteroidia bacterium]